MFLVREASFCFPTQSAKGDSMTGTGHPTKETGHATIMPAAFLGHGASTITFEDNRFTSAWRAFGTAAPRPRTK
jgi:hypothetical protein